MPVSRTNPPRKTMTCPACQGVGKRRQDGGPMPKDRIRRILNRVQEMPFITCGQCEGNGRVKNPRHKANRGGR